MDDQKKDHPDPKRTALNNYGPKNVPINEVENTNGINLGEDLLFDNKPQI